LRLNGTHAAGLITWWSTRIGDQVEQPSLHPVRSKVRRGRGANITIRLGHSPLFLRSNGTIVPGRTLAVIRAKVVLGMKAAVGRGLLDYEGAGWREEGMGGG
jgi:hypothetical protein